MDNRANPSADRNDLPAPPAGLWSRAVTCLCFTVTGPADPPPPWTPGPLPVTLPDGRPADRRARASYFQARAAAALYGAPDDTSPSRWHRPAGTSHVEEGSVLGIELLRFPRYAAAAGTTGPPSGHSDSVRYLCILHLALCQDNPLTRLADAVRLDPGNPRCAERRSRYADLAGNGFQIGTDLRRAISVTMITPAADLQPSPGIPHQWTAANGWLWAAASATPLDQFAPDPEDPRALDGLVYLSATWRALVLRDGLAFLGLAPDTDGTSGFYAWGETYVRTLYTDVTLLAALERDALDDFANRLANIGDRFERSQQLRRLVNEVTEFRNVFWWEIVTRHGNANVILDQLHSAHRTPRLFTRVIEDLDAFRRIVETQVLEASVQIQEREERRSRRIERAASIAAFAITLPLLAFAALAVPMHGITSGDHDLPAWLVATVGLGSMLTGAFIGTAGARWISNRAP